MRFVLAVAALVLLSALAMAQEARGQDRVALLIGNAEYAHEDALRNPLNDVAAMKLALEALEFDVTVVENADERAMGRALQDFSRLAEGADTALIFFSGHGMEIRGRNYLIPVDARLQRETDARYEAVPLADALASASGASRLSIVIVDACRDNRFPAGSYQQGARGGQSRGFHPVRAARGQLIAFATAPGAVATSVIRLRGPGWIMGWR